MGNLGLSAGGSGSRFVMPAEWDRHDATWLAFPHNRTDWPGKLPAVQWAHAEIARKVSEGEHVNLLVNDERSEQKARRLYHRAGVREDALTFTRIPTNRGWMRDSGPIFVRRQARGSRGKAASAELAVKRFRFTAWAKYTDHGLDDRVSLLAARAVGVPLLEARVGNGPADPRLVLEGGSIDVNGHGAILTTEECLLDPTVQVRNPQLTRAGWERLFMEHLGASHTIWLGRGIAGDDTHGHVDDIARFVSRRTIVACRELQSNDVNYGPLEENWERLQSARLDDGSRVEVVALPMPAPLAIGGQRLPASYANFYICNAAVLVPTFNDPNDRVALGILAEFVRDRPVIGVHAVDLVLGQGTLHCLTQQQPAT